MGQAQTNLPDLLSIDPDSIPKAEIPAMLSALSALQGRLAVRLLAIPGESATCRA